MNEDATLLRRYAEEKSEAAFAELVRRHLDLVYSAAQRRLGGDAHRAADVAQVVFTKLACEAGRLARHTVLTAWLYTATRNAAVDTIRAEQRRRAREQEAHLMHTLNESAAPSEAEWAQLRPILDAAMDELAETDRAAVLLRYFEKCGFAEIGAALGLSEDAARMRVDRALDRLRTRLARRGVASAAGALAAGLAGQTVTAAPVGLLATISSAAIPGALADAGAAAGWASFFTMTKIKIGIVTATALAGLTVAWVDVRASRALSEEINQLSTENAELARLQRDNQRLAATAARQAEVRQVAAASTTPRTKSIPRAAVAPSSTMKPAAEWRNAGLATPGATLETQLWAKAHGDMAVLASAFIVSETTKQHASAFFAGLSEAARARFGTPEGLAVYFRTFAPWESNVPPADVTAFRLIDDAEADALGMTKEGAGWAHWVTQTATGQNSRFSGRFTQTPGGWRTNFNTSAAQWQKMTAYFDPVTGDPKKGKK